MNNENIGTGIQTGLDEVLAQSEKAKAEAQADNIGVKIANHESVMLPFTGEARTRTASGESNGKAWSGTKVDFVLSAKTPNGESKVWSVSISNPIVTEVIALLKKGLRNITIHREGESTSTRYSIQKERVI